MIHRRDGAELVSAADQNLRVAGECRGIARNRNHDWHSALGQFARLGFRTLIPFIRKWGYMPDNYEALYQEMLDGIQQPDFTGSWELITAWGTTTI